MSNAAEMLIIFLTNHLSVPVMARNVANAKVAHNGMYLSIHYLYYTKPLITTDLSLRYLLCTVIWKHANG